MTSVVSICNMALSHIGKATINSLDEQSEEAFQCQLHYDQTRKVMLQGYHWRFALRVQSLAEIDNAWEQRYQRAYTRPSDCLKPIRVVPEVDRPAYPYNFVYDPYRDIALQPNGLYGYEIRGDVIFTDVSPATLEYVSDVTDPSEFAPLFIEALAWAIASKVSMPLTRDQGIRKEAFTLAQSALAQAQTADANEVADMYGQQSELIGARY